MGRAQESGLPQMQKVKELLGVSEGAPDDGGGFADRVGPVDSKVNATERGAGAEGWLLPRGESLGGAVMGGEFCMGYTLPRGVLSGLFGGPGQMSKRHASAETCLLRSVRSD
jgi:hypothetical protein